ncbi:hypothetical protein J2S43_000302 [Catenuloplanes nepalensis]|uniref:Uncharacterized protein n=1 Tax=Catenuloplanes nepalensis TaxID=587533 RepID=A0ABT9MK58_9ACTN|nr:hypothetical protein [Catenuloplanes nepalensis]MDP9791790.1 hypothetical protein [Catenuloplanes nepalensis]
MRHLGGRPLTVAGGLLLGLLLAAVLLALNVMGVHVDERPPPRAATTTRPGTPLTGNQPELTRALLSRTDLGDRFTPAPTPPAPSRTPDATEPAPEPSVPDAPVPRAERCRTLFDAPWELVPTGHELTDQATTDLNPSGGTGGSAPALPLLPRLRQTLSRFADDGAAAAYDAIRTSVADCRTFETTLEDGTLATVSLHELEVASGGADGAYAVRITAVGGDRVLTGYLAVGRVGQMLSVLRTVGPEGTVDSGDADPTLDLAVDKMELIEDLIDSD